MWLTARELVGLPGFEMSTRAARDKLIRLGAPNRLRPGRTGGGGLEYDCTALPAETQAAITARQISAAGSVALTVVDTPAVRSFAPPAPPVPADIPGTLVPSPEPKRRQPSQAEKDVADARMRLVTTVQGMVTLGGLRRACQLLAAQILTGEAGGEMQSIARLANQRARGDMVSARTLERWVGMQRADGWWGLLPAQVEKTHIPYFEDDVAAVLGMYHSRDSRFRKLSHAAKEVTRSLGRDFDSWQSLYHRARRALDKVGQSAEANVALIKARHTGVNSTLKVTRVRC